MGRRLVRFFRNDRAQDLAEYCLLTALIALISLGIFWRMRGGVMDLWSTANTTLTHGGSTTGTTGTSSGVGPAAGSATTTQQDQAK